jgi:8-oxo-dGTP pyrophosphatase MutT (NUDIX family)
LIVMDALSTKAFSAEEFRRRAMRVKPDDTTDYGDHRFNPELRDLIVRPGLRAAAVLVPVVDHGPAATVLLTKRTERMRSHPGQVAFPGGTIDGTDGSPEAAALRETEEEIGLGADDIEIVGRMPDYFSGSGFRIAPVLGIVRADYLATLNADEVEDVFEVPLAFLMNPSNFRRGSRIWNERERFFYTTSFGGREIWGVTAGIIRTLYERLYA